MPQQQPQQPLPPPQQQQQRPCIFLRGQQWLIYGIVSAPELNGYSATVLQPPCPSDGRVAVRVHTLGGPERDIRVKPERLIPWRA